MSTDQLLHFTQQWAWSHNYKAHDVYPVISRGEIVLFFVRDVGMVQP